MRRTVAIRVDSGTFMGSGHLMRCLTLARELCADFDVIFICREHAGTLSGLARAAGFAVIDLPPPRGAARDGANPDWLGVDQGDDVAQTLAALPSNGIDWLIVDHYGIDARWESMLRARARRLLVIDDLANRAHDCDVLLDQNYFGPATLQRYEGLVPRHCVQLLGPRHALLRPDYAQHARALPPRDALLRRALVFFGGSDSHNSTADVISAFDDDELRDVALDVVIGANHPDPAGIAALAAARPGTIVHQGLPTLVGLMCRADIAIGAGGSTTWERACVGLPSLVEVVAENQRAFSMALAEEGYQLIVDARPGDALGWRTAIKAARSDRMLLARMSARCRGLVDGQGARRVVAHLTMNADDALTVSRSCDPAADAFELHSGDGTFLTAIRLTGDAQGAGLRIEFDEPLLTRGLEFRRAAVAATLRNDETRGGFLRLAGAVPAATALRITFLTDRESWLNPQLAGFAASLLDQGHQLRWIHQVQDLAPGDVCFILSFSAIVRASHRALHRHNIVVHASDLPNGRGWSPMSWKILAGMREIPVSLFEAAEAVDSGPIYLTSTIGLSGTELVGEWRELLATTTVDLCARWIDGFPASAARGREQTGQPSYYARRRPPDSALDPQRTLAEQFELLRVVDNENYPAFFEYRGRRFELQVRAASADLQERRSK